MDRAGLDDGARRRGEPMPALAETEAGNRAAIGIAGADLRDQPKMRTYQLDRLFVHVRPECAKLRRVQVDPRVQKAARPRDKNHPDVHALTTLDIWNDSDHAVLMGGSRIRHPCTSV